MCNLRCPYLAIQRIALLVALVILANPALGQSNGSGEPDSTECSEAVQTRISDELANWYAERDGAMHFYQVPVLFQMCLSKPDVFYALMSEDSAAFESFVGVLEFSVFNNPYSRRDSVYLENKRTHAIARLEEQQVPAEYVQLQKRVAAVLNDVVVENQK